MTNVNPFNTASESLPMPSMDTDNEPAPIAQPQPQAVPQPQQHVDPQAEALKEQARQAELDDIEADIAAEIDRYHAQAILEDKAMKDNNVQQSSEEKENKAKQAAAQIAKTARSKDAGMKSLERVGIMATIGGVVCMAIYLVPTIQWLLSILGTVLLVGGMGILGYLLLKDKRRQDKILKALTQGYETATEAVKEVAKDATKTE